MSISVIIPVYNAERYLEACVLSLRRFAEVAHAQTEIIIVDDGSTDGSSELCDILGDKAIHQQNLGVSVARNVGMSLATNTWLWFVDADDFIEPINSDVCLPKDCDFVNLGFVWEENGKINSFGATPGEIPYNLWRCWFRRDLVLSSELQFTKGRKYAEDQEFILKYLLNSKSLVKEALPQLQYHYTVRPGSAITRKGVKMKQIKDVLGVALSIWGYALRKRNIPSWIWSQTKRMIKTAIVLACRI